MIFFYKIQSHVDFLFFFKEKFRTFDKKNSGYILAKDVPNLVSKSDIYRIIQEKDVKKLVAKIFPEFISFSNLISLLSQVYVEHEKKPVTFLAIVCSK